MDEIKPAAPGSAQASTVVVHEGAPLLSEKDQAIKDAKSKDEHMLSFAQIMDKHHTSFDPVKPTLSKGLTEEQAAEKLLINGPNVLTPAKAKSSLELFIHCLTNKFNLLLIFCAILTWIVLALPNSYTVSGTYFGAILLMVAIINALIEWVQMRKSAQILLSFLNLIPAKCTIVRDGLLKPSSAQHLVLGDVVFVRMGDKIPADIYVFHAGDFKVDNSSLTGESEPQERVAFNSHESPLEATNLAFNSTLVIAGEAYGVVIRTGDHTVLGQIANLTQGEKKRISPLTQEIDRFVNIIFTLACSTAIIFFIISIVATGQTVSTSLSFAIGVLVAWVPQGLPATVILLLSIAASRMAQRQVLVKDLKAVETLGAITLLATDKTGTLTRNQMTVTNFWTSKRLSSASSDPRQLAPEEAAFELTFSGLSEILHISSMCSRARFDRTDVSMDKRAVSGDATESGLLRFAAAKLNDIDELGDKYPKVFEIPFNSDNKWHMTIHQKPTPQGHFTLFMKGAPERVLKVCSHILIDGEAVLMTEEYKLGFQKSYEYMAGKGHRVLAFAQKLLGKDFPEGFVFDKETKNYPSTELCFVGLASLEDPPKHGVREAIGHCREAGVKVMMVTGDHPLTAEAIGRKINLMISDTKERLAKRTGRSIESIKEDEVFAIVIHGERIDYLTDQDWDNIFSKDEIIFARTSPKHKLEIVKKAQALGHIVGVTGDGVNDSPALKKADLGIAMNMSGSDVSKEAAAMILLDDNFASTINGISEGRLIFANLKKSIQYVVTHIVPEVIPYLIYVAVPLPLAIAPLQILAVDLGFELFVAISFAWEPPESKSGLMKMGPRKPVTAESIQRLRVRDARRARLAGRSAVVDPESGPVEPSTLHQCVAAIKAPFTKLYWIDLFETPEGDILVDSTALSWAYLEAGAIETIGCLVAFFVVLWDAKSLTTGLPFNISPYDARVMQKQGLFNGTTGPAIAFNTTSGNPLSNDDLVESLNQAQSIYYFGILLIQLFNLFICKCRYRLPFGKTVLSNRYTWYGALGGVLVGLFIVYVPGVNIPFTTSYHLLPLYWLIPIAFGFVLLGYATLRTLVLRVLRPITWNPEIGGLQMYPTRFSTK